MKYVKGATLLNDPDAWDRRPICLTGNYSGHPRWHALQVAPQKEHASEAWLKLRGVEAFHPVKSRQTVNRGARKTIETAYLPGFVFARFPGKALRSRVLAFPHIRGALCVQSGHWGIIRPQDIRQLYSMRSTEAALNDRKARASTLTRGDKAKVLEGLWMDGQEVEILEIKAGRAKFKLHMFGADIDAEADVDALRKIG